MKISKIQLREMIRKELLPEAGFDRYKDGVDFQNHIRNVFITKHSTGDVTFHIGGRSDLAIRFNALDIKKMVKMLKKAGAI